MSLNLTGANLPMRAQMTGIASQRSDMGMIRRREETRIDREETTTRERSETRDAPKDKYTPTAAEDQPKTHQKKAQQVIARFVSETDNTGQAKKAQTHDTKMAKKQAEAREQGDAKETGNKAPVDNASRIGLMYQQKMRKQKGEQFQVGERNAQQPKLKQFLGNLKNYVKLEYQQYTKSDISTYSRRNLREILSALGDDVKAFDNKAVKDRRDRQNTSVAGLKFYNKHHATQATRNLKLFNEDPMQDPNYNPFEMIA